MESVIIPLSLTADKMQHYSFQDNNILHYCITSWNSLGFN